MQCFPFKDTWFLVYRSFEEDPVMGGKEKCVAVTETGPFENDVAPTLLQYGSDANMWAEKGHPGYRPIILLKLLPYKTRNVFRI